MTFFFVEYLIGIVLFGRKFRKYRFSFFFKLVYFFVDIRDGKEDVLLRRIEKKVVLGLNCCYREFIERLIYADKIFEN